MFEMYSLNTRIVNERIFDYAHKNNNLTVSINFKIDVDSETFFDILICQIRYNI